MKSGAAVNTTAANRYHPRRGGRLSRDSSARVLMAQEERLHSARRRRERATELREQQARRSGQRRVRVTQRVQQARWREDRQTDAVAHELRCTNESIIMQRKLYKGIVRRLNEIRLIEHSETKEKLKQISEEAEIQMASLQNLFEDKLALLKEQEAVQRQSEKAERGTTFRRTAVRCAADTNADILKRQSLVDYRHSLLQQKRQRQLNTLREQSEEKLSTISTINRLPGAKSRRRSSLSSATVSVGVDEKRGRGAPAASPRPSIQRRPHRHETGNSDSNHAAAAAAAEVLLAEIDKQVSDLVRQQQHDSMSHGWRLQAGADAENQPIRNYAEEGAEDSLGRVGAKPLDLLSSSVGVDLLRAREGIKGESITAYRGAKQTDAIRSMSTRKGPGTPPQRVSAWK